MEGLVPHCTPRRAAGAASSDSFSVTLYMPPCWYTWLAKNVRRKVARSLLDAGLETVFAANAREMSLLHALFYVHSGTDLDVLLEHGEGGGLVGEGVVEGQRDHDRSLGGLRGWMVECAERVLRARRVEERRLSAREVRDQASDVAAARRHDEHANNNDEVNYPGTPLVGNYSKSLRHDSLGDPIPASYATLLRALQSEDPADFEEIMTKVLGHPAPWTAAEAGFRKAAGRTLCVPRTTLAPPADGRYTVLASTSRLRYGPHARATWRPDLHVALWNPYQALDIEAPAGVVEPAASVRSHSTAWRPGSAGPSRRRRTIRPATS